MWGLQLVESVLEWAMPLAQLWAMPLAQLWARRWEHVKGLQWGMTLAQL
jgi:hypothetical protein